MFSLCTLEFWVCRLDPPVEQTAASLLSLLDDCSSGPALSDGRGSISELRPEKHSLPLWSDILTACRHTKQQHTSHDLRSLQDWKVVCLLLSSVRIVKEESATVRWLDEEVQETDSDYNLYVHQTSNHQTSQRKMTQSQLLTVRYRTGIPTNVAYKDWILWK